MGRYSMNGASRCSACYQTGHNKRTCPQRSDRVKAEEKKHNRKRACRYCAQEGHNQRTCPVQKEHFKALRSLVSNYRRGVLGLLQRNGIAPGALLYAPVFADRTGFDGVMSENLAMVREIKWSRVLPEGRFSGLWSTPHGILKPIIFTRVGTSPTDGRIAELRDVFGPMAQRRLNGRHGKGFDRPQGLKIPLHDQIASDLVGKTEEERKDLHGAAEATSDMSRGWFPVSPSPAELKPPVGWLECEDESYEQWITAYKLRIKEYFKGESVYPAYCPAHFFRRSLRTTRNKENIPEVFRARIDPWNSLGFTGEMTVNNIFCNFSRESPAETKKFGPACLRWR